MGNIVALTNHSSGLQTAQPLNSTVRFRSERENVTMTPEDILGLMLTWNDSACDERKYMQTFWHEPDGYSYSSNGFCILRVAGAFGVDDTNMPAARALRGWDAVEGAAKDGLGSPAPVAQINKLKEAYRCSACGADCATGSWDAPCRGCRGSGKTKCHCCDSEIDCDWCDGSGVIEQHRYATSECPECHGTGIEYDKYGNTAACVEIGGKLYSGAMVSFLDKQLSNLKFHPDLASDGVLPFSYDGGTGMIANVKQ